MNSTRLKEETKEYHDNVERVMNSSLMFSNQFTPAHYTTFIQKSNAYLDTIVPLVARDWPEYLAILTAKQEALLKDLKFSKETELPTKESTDVEENKFFTLGLVYIVLGAMLGNKIILKQLHTYTEFEGYPFAYLSEHQDQLSEIWKDFQMKVNGLDEGNLHNVIEGAKKGYSLFGE